MSYINLTFADAEGDTSSTSQRVADAAGAQALATATKAMSMGSMNKAEYIVPAQLTGTVAGKATDINANKEVKWLVSWIDNTTNEGGSIEIPVANNALKLAGQNIADPANATVTAYIAAFNTNYRNKAGNQCTVDDIRITGR